jgi:chromosome segregation ATPase
MMLLDQQFNTINDKLQLLLKQFSKLQKENQRLNEALKEYRQKEEALEHHIQELQQQVAVLKMGTGAMDEKDKKHFERKLNQYIKEVDRCIAFLSE